MPTAIRAITRVQDGDDVTATPSASTDEFQLTWDDASEKFILVNRMALPYTHTLVVDQGGRGAYTSIKAACDYIATQSPSFTDRWLLSVTPGVYTEAAFVVPTYVAIKGSSAIGSPGSTWITTSITSGSFITLANYASIQNVFVGAAPNCTGDFILLDLVNPSSSEAYYMSDCWVSFQPTANGFTTIAVRNGHGLINNTTVYTGSQCGVAVSGRDLGVSNCRIYGGGGIAIECRHPTGGTVIWYTRIGGGDGGHNFTTELSAALPNGKIYVYGTPYHTSSGTIVMDDRFFDSVQAVREAVAADQIPLILKAAAAQTAGLLSLQDSAGGSLGTIFEADGKANFATAGMKSAWTRTLIVDQGGKGNFTSVSAACDYVATQSPSSASQWTILVMPGAYTEAPFTIPTYTLVKGISQAPSANVQATVYITNTTIEAGTFITLAAGAALDTIGINVTVPGTMSAAVKALEGDGRLNQVWLNLGNSGAFQLYGVYGSWTIAHSVIYAGSNYTTAAYFTSGSQIKFSRIQSPTSAKTDLFGVVNASGNSTILYSFFGATTGDLFDPAINVTGGIVYCTCVSYKTGVGNIISPNTFATRTLIVDQGGKGNFTSVSAACDYVATQSPSSASQWTILVMPGAYTEAPFTIPTYTLVKGISQAPSANVQATVYITNTTIEAGTFITLAAGAALDTIGINVTVPGTMSAAVKALEGDGRLNQVWLNLGNSGAFQLYGVYGSWTIAHSVIYAGSNYTTAAYFTSGSQIKFSRIQSPTSAKTDLFGVVNASGNSTILYSFFGATTGDFFDPAINVTGGAVYCTFVSYQTGVGNIISPNGRTHVADAKANYVSGELDSEAEIITALNAINTTLNAVLASLEAAGIHKLV